MSVLLFFIKFLVCLGGIVFDLIYEEIIDRSAVDIIFHFCFLALVGLNTVFLYQYKIR